MGNILVEGEQIAMLSSHKDNKCLLHRLFKKNQHIEQWNCNTLCPISYDFMQSKIIGFDKYMYIAQSALGVFRCDFLPGSILN